MHAPLHRDRQSPRAPRRGITLLEVLGVIAVVLVILAIVLALNPRNRRRVPELVASTQLKQIQQSMVIYARENKGRFVEPAFERRLPAIGLGYAIGQGPPNIMENTTANLYSLTIMLNLLPPDILISPLEKNPVVQADSDYNYKLHDPTQRIFWDPNFTADLDTGSNASFAHPVLYGWGRDQHWRDTGNSRVINFSMRGPRDGNCANARYSCTKKSSWTGYVVFADNSMQKLESTVQVNDDNIFLQESGNDAFLTFTRAFRSTSNTMLEVTYSWD